jgi:hypothetical protein
LVVSLFVFMNSSLDPLHDDIQTKNGRMLLLVYQSWEHAGQIQDATILKCEDVERIIQPCGIRLSFTESNDLEARELTTSQTDSCSEPKFLIEWAIFAKGILGQRNLGYPIELRKISNRSDQLILDSQDLNRIQSPLMVHDYNCGIGGSTTGFKKLGLNVTVAVEANEIASDSWMVAPTI